MVLFFRSLRNVGSLVRELFKVLGSGYRETYGYRFGSRDYQFDIWTLVFDIVYTLVLLVIAVPIDVLYVMGYVLQFTGGLIVAGLDVFRRWLERPTWIFWRKRSWFRREIESSKYD